MVEVSANAGVANESVVAKIGAVSLTARHACAPIIFPPACFNFDRGAGVVAGRELWLVIASEAKQSRSYRQELDCFVALLLAMTR